MSFIAMEKHDIITVKTTILPPTQKLIYGCHNKGHEMIALKDTTDFMKNNLG